MQLFLNFLFDTVFLVGGTYLGVGFVLGLIELWYKSDPELLTLKSQTSETQPLALPESTAIPVHDMSAINLTVSERELVEETLEAFSDPPYSPPYS